MRTACKHYCSPGAATRCPPRCGAGGAPSAAFAYIRDNGGLDSEASYPYKAVVADTCLFKPSGVAAEDTGAVQLPAKDERDAIVHAYLLQVSTSRHRLLPARHAGRFSFKARLIVRERACLCRVGAMSAPDA